MKNQLFLAILLIWCSANTVHGQQAIYQEITKLKMSGLAAEKNTPLEFLSLIDNRDVQFQGLTNGNLLNVREEVLSKIINEKSEFIQIDLPVSQRNSMTLTLRRNEIFTSDFAVYLSSNTRQSFKYQSGVHYSGIVDGDPHSLVAISFFEDHISGLITTDKGNLVLGRVKNDAAKRHVLYNDKDIDAPLVFNCGMSDDGPGYTEEQLSDFSGQRDPGDCIRVYVEIDDTIVTHQGGAMNALSFITSAFNQVITIYANENVTMSLSEILVWTTPSPYNGTTSGEMNAAFINNTGSFNGDLAHLVSFNAMGSGVAAGFDGICNSNPDLSKCFSGIWPVYNVFPVWTWTVNVIAHEMGHLIGCRHTHACVWNFNNTAIDGCAGATEGTCQLPGNPAGGGTIMSYCQNVSGIGVNLSLGFGPQPGNVLRNTVKTLGNCLSSACTQTVPQYCWSGGSPDQPGHAIWIQSVALDSINNVSGNNYTYGDYTALSTILNADSTYTITMTAGNQGVNFVKSWAVWIDYNNDLDWYDAGEQIASGNGSLIVNFNFTVPSTAQSVTTRMRVAMKRADSGGPLSPCGFAPVGEVEDYTVIIQTPAGPTCDDGAQNGDETGVDCGGSNCPVCPTCSDGIQNGNEAGIDCGGSCGNECPGTLLFGHYFETGWDGWTDGGDDVNRYSGNNSWEGNYSINLQDNSGELSAMTSPAINLSGLDSVKLEFYFYAISMENGEDFLVRYFDGTSYTTVDTYISGYGGHFSNNRFWYASLKLTSSDVNFVSNARFKLQCDGSDNNDDIYVDAVTLTGYNNVPNCPDEDGDEVCDSLDVCPGFNDNLIGTSCDDSNECTENDVYVGGPGCNCAGTAIPGCVPCNPQTQTLTPNPLTHTGTGSTSTNVLSLPVGSSDVTFTISGLNAKLGGNASGRFIDRVKVWFNSGSGAQLYGTFNGDQQSSVDVSIAGSVQSVWVTLEDGYDGNSSVLQSVSFSSLTHCTGSQAPVQGDDPISFQSIESRSPGIVTKENTLHVYPNPVFDVLNISFDGEIKSLQIVNSRGDDVIFFNADIKRSIDISTLSPGIYFLLLESDSGWNQVKFCKL